MVRRWRRMSYKDDIIDFSIVPEHLRDRVIEMYENRRRVSELRKEAAELDKRQMRVCYGAYSTDPYRHLDSDYDEEILGWMIGYQSSQLARHNSLKGY